MKKLLLIFSSVLLLAACEKQSELVTLMEIDNVQWQKGYTPSGTNLHFKLYAESQSSVVQRITIMSSDRQFKDRFLLDTMLAMPLKKVDLSFYYELPYYTDTMIVKFTGCAYDGSGRAASYPISINVAAGDEPIRPVDGITLYSAASSGKSAFSLTSMQAVYLGTDSTAVAWFDLINRPDSDVLSRAWHSEAKISFSRAEGFNYAEATAHSISETWKNMQSSTTIKQLKADDILLFGIQDEAYGALKIIAVYDEAGTENDRYVFSLKSIKTYTPPIEEDK